MMATSGSPALAAPRIDLMPHSEIVRRERDALVRRWVWIVFGAIVVTLLIIAGAFWFKLLADQRLAAEQARTNNLLIEIASLSEVSQALATESELTDFRAQAMATDLQWAPVFAKLTGVLPLGTTLTGYELTVGQAPRGDDPTLEPGLEGTVVFTSPTAIDIVPIIRSLRNVEGVLFADGQSVTSSPTESDVFTYRLTAQFDQTVYSGAFSASEDGGE